jgi:hypothetical protein
LDAKDETVMREGEPSHKSQKRTADNLRSCLLRNDSACVEEIIRCMEAVHFSKPAEQMVAAWLLMYPRYVWKTVRNIMCLGKCETEGNLCLWIASMVESFEIPPNLA